MPNYRLCTLYSGSGGNAAYLETPTARILIDAGKSTRTLLLSLKELGVEPDSLDAIFITHEHNDHVAALEVLTKKHKIPVHILLKCALRYRDTQPEALCKCLRIYEKAPFTVQVGEVTVTAFETPHDSRASVGYRFEFPDGEQTIRVGYATDIGHVTDTLREGLTECESVVLESNHDPIMLMDGPYPYDLKLRIRGKRGHLSNRECADLAAELAGQGTVNFLLAHLSEENNHPDIAFDETFSALAGYPTALRIASPNAITMLVGDETHPIPKITEKVPEEVRP
jgi:phosphoribosyl 1,2-cyclic phosphodiesterase